MNICVVFLIAFSEFLQSAKVRLVNVFHDLVVVFYTKEVLGHLCFEHQVHILVAVLGALGLGGLFHTVAPRSPLFPSTV